MTRRAAAVAAAAIVVTTSAHAFAQVRPVRQTPRSGSWELGGGVMITGSFSGADATAELTRNGEQTGGFDLFTAEGEIKSGPGAGASIGYYLSPTIAVEAGLRYSRPRLSYRLSDDAEEAQTVTAEETLSRYVFTGSVVFHLRRAIGRRFIPFVMGGAGYIRELHQGNELIETGTEFHALGGIKYWFGTTGRRFGLRGQAGLSMTDGGFDFREDGSRTLPIASASLVYLF